MSDKQLLVELITKIIDCDGTEEEIDAWLIQAQELVKHPSLSDLIFYPENEEVTPDEIANEALSYQPLSLG